MWPRWTPATRAEPLPLRTPRHFARRAPAAPTPPYGPVMGIRWSSGTSRSRQRGSRAAGCRRAPWRAGTAWSPATSRRDWRSPDPSTGEDRELISTASRRTRARRRRRGERRRTADRRRRLQGGGTPLLPPSRRSTDRGERVSAAASPACAAARSGRRRRSPRPRPSPKPIERAAGVHESSSRGAG